MAHALSRFMPNADRLEPQRIEARAIKNWPVGHIIFIGCLLRAFIASLSGTRTKVTYRKINQKSIFSNPAWMICNRFVTIFPLKTISPIL